MYMEYETFEKTMVACQAVFNTWDDMMKEFTAIARDREFPLSVLPFGAIPDLTSSFHPS
jgi:hypothetical protein